jgi:hypothetical protein
MTALFDFSLAAPATSQLVRVAYGLTLVVLAVLGIVGVLYAALLPFAIAVLVLTATILGVLVGAVLVRLWLGAMLALSRIEERTEELAEQVAGIALNTAPVWAPERHAAVEPPGGMLDEP